MTGFDILDRNGMNGVPINIGINYRNQSSIVAISWQNNNP